MNFDYSKKHDVKHTKVAEKSIKRKNLQKLADYLSKLPANYDKFDMDSFAFREISDSYNNSYPYPFDVKEIPCGTVCCAVGHSPSAGIGKIGESLTWFDYLDKYLLDYDYWSYSGKYANGEDLFEFCFSMKWVLVDNTPQGAANRIEYILNYGLPENHSELSDTYETLLDRQ